MKLSAWAAAAIMAASLSGWFASVGSQPETLAQDAAGKPPATARLQLPLPDPVFQGKNAETFKDSTPNYPKAVRVPKGSQNVLLILLDDVGFGMCPTFGGPVPAPLDVDHRVPPVRSMSEF